MVSPGQGEKRKGSCFRGRSDPRGSAGRGRQGPAHTHPCAAVRSGVQHWALHLLMLQVLRSISPSCPCSRGWQEGHPPQGGELAANTVQPASHRLGWRESYPRGLPKCLLITSERFFWKEKPRRVQPLQCLPPCCIPRSQHGVSPTTWAGLSPRLLHTHLSLQKESRCCCAESPGLSRKVESKSTELVIYQAEAVRTVPFRPAGKARASLPQLSTIHSPWEA